MTGAIHALRRDRRAKIGGLIGLAGAALAGAAIITGYRAARAERRHLPLGRFVTAGGARLHYIEAGKGPAVVFLHGNGAMAEDFLISGTFKRAAQRYRAVAFDRPGFGHSDRPHARKWSARAQASILPQAFKLLGIERPVVIGHSWGTLVALALALDHPQLVSALVLASGYYYPTPRSDVALFSPPAIPLIGSVISHTIAPFIGEAMAPSLIEKMFAPQGVSPAFAQNFPLALCLRPSQIRAFSEDSAHMIVAAAQLSSRYGSLFPPAVVMAGDADQIVSHRQAQRLHRDLPGSRLDIFQGGSHMIHHVDPVRFVRGIDSAAAMANVERHEQI
jgi:pimeloyl-ACP methyl ester carboxylesterase